MKIYKIFLLFILVLFLSVGVWFALSDAYYSFITVENVELEDEYWVATGDKIKFDIVNGGAVIRDRAESEDLIGKMFVDRGVTLHDIQSVVKIGSNLESVTYSLGLKSSGDDAILTSGGMLRNVWLLWVSSGLKEGSKPYPLVVYVNFVYPELDDDQALPEIATVTEYCILIGEKG